MLTPLSAVGFIASLAPNIIFLHLIIKMSLVPHQRNSFTIARIELATHTNPRLTSRIELHCWCLISYHCKELRHINCAKGLAPLGAEADLIAHIASAGFYKF